MYGKLLAVKQKQWDTVGTDIHKDCNGGFFSK